jgi:Zn-dependent M28 family amino/carboxypeptidase
MPLTSTFVKQVKHSGKTTGDTHWDGSGMYLLVKASGKYWLEQQLQTQHSLEYYSDVSTIMMVIY